MATTITGAEWRALLARWPDGVVPPHHTIFGAGPKYLMTADLVTIRETSGLTAVGPEAVTETGV